MKYLGNPYFYLTLSMIALVALVGYSIYDALQYKPWHEQECPNITRDCQVMRHNR